MNTKAILIFCLMLFSAPAQADSIEDVLKQLQATETSQAAQEKLEELWMQKGSDTAQLLVHRAKKAFVEREAEQALEHVRDVVRLNQSYAYGWRVYAQISGAEKDFGAALTGLLHAVSLEPNDYVAWSTLGMTLEQTQRYEEAFYAYQQASAVNPHDERAKDGISRLQGKIQGVDI
jgi:Flp pilus assembly protein TadD